MATSPYLGVYAATYGPYAGGGVALPTQLPVTTAQFANNALDETTPGGQPRRSPLATLRRVTVSGATAVTFRQYTSIAGSAFYGGTVVLDGTTTLSVLNSVGVGEGTTTIQLPDTGPHTLDWMDGIQYRATDSGDIQYGGTLLAISVTGGTLTMAAPGPRAKNAVAVLGDSISNAVGATLLNLGWLPLLRAELAARTGETWEIAAIGYSSKGWKSVGESNEFARLGGYLSAFLGGRTGRAILANDLGVNCWNLSLVGSLAGMQSIVAGWLDYVHATYPAITQYLKTPVYNPDGTQQRGASATLPQFCGALLDTAGSRSFVSSFDAYSLLVASDIDSMDRLHPVNSGHRKIMVGWADKLLGQTTTPGMGTPEVLGYLDSRIIGSNGLATNTAKQIRYVGHDPGQDVRVSYSLGIKYQISNAHPEFLGATVRILKDGNVAVPDFTMAAGYVYEDHTSDGLGHLLQVVFVEAGTAAGHDGYLTVEDGTFTLYA